MLKPKRVKTKPRTLDQALKDAVSSELYEDALQAKLAPKYQPQFRAVRSRARHDPSRQLDDSSIKLIRIPLIIPSDLYIRFAEAAEGQGGTVIEWILAMARRNMLKFEELRAQQAMPNRNTGK